MCNSLADFLEMRAVEPHIGLARDEASFDQNCRLVGSAEKSEARPGRRPFVDQAGYSGDLLRHLFGQIMLRDIEAHRPERSIGVAVRIEMHTDIEVAILL